LCDFFISLFFLGPTQRTGPAGAVFTFFFILITLNGQKINLGNELSPNIGRYSQCDEQ